MSIKSKAFAAAAALAVVGGVGTAGAMSAGAATPSCGHRCIDVFSRQFGTHHSPNYVLDVWRQAARVGQPLILFRSSNSDPAEDFTVSYQGQVSDFHAAHLVSDQVNLHYGDGSLEHGGEDEPAFEIEYSPYGVDSGLCVGLPTTAIQNEGVVLEPCGVTAKTVWILDSFDRSFPAFFHDYFPAINGSDTNFSHPFVLTYPSNGYPTDIPRPQLQVRNLTGFSNGHGRIVGTVIDTQLWGADFGVLR
jgi:hypothetical protein